MLCYATYPVLRGGSKKKSKSDRRMLLVHTLCLFIAPAAALQIRTPALSCHHPTAAAQPRVAHRHHSTAAQPRVARSRVRCAAVSDAVVPAAVSLVAGSFGGAIGLGVAYPLDTLKTKTQSSAGGSTPSNPFALAAQIYKAEGLQGFYSGVSISMAGQALIKGVLFFVYGGARNFVAGTALGLSTLGLCLAASFSGAVSSLVMCPVERVKCVMQARAAGSFANPIACIGELVRQDGAYGLVFRGFGATVLREMPACTLYLVGYELAKATLLATTLPRMAVLLLSGAFAGAASWVPVYPIDVVKTQIQVEMGSSGDEQGESFVGTAKRLWQAGGFWAFWDGLGPKLARAIINHAVTFLVFDALCGLYLRRR